MYATIPGREIEKRIERFQELMSTEGVDLSVIIYSPDLFYFTGVVQQGVLVIDVENEPIFFVRRFFERAVEESPLKNIIKIESPVDIVPILGSRIREVERVGFELDVMPVNSYNRFSGIFQGKDIIDISVLVRQTRSIKSIFEIELMRKSGKKLVGLIKEGGEYIRAGRKESEVVADMIKFALDNGHGGTIRLRNWNQDIPFGHILSGDSGCTGTFTDSALGGKGRHPSLPFGPGEKVIREGEPVIVDMMWVEEGYITDMTRVYSLGEIEDGDIHKAHEIAIDIIRNAENNLKPGESSRAVLKESKKIAAHHNLQDLFMGIPGNNVTFLGHGIGIEVNEFPFVADSFDFSLAEGMTLALEPKFIIDGKGAVGVENTYLITSDGFENLTEMEEGIIVI